MFGDVNGKTIVSPLEYETIGLMGSNLGIDNLTTSPNCAEKSTTWARQHRDRGGSGCGGAGRLDEIW